MALISGGGRLGLDEGMERFRLKRVSWLVNELRANKSKDCSMVDYLQRKISISETLRTLEHHISDDQLKFQILKGLPDCYVTMPLELMECSVTHLATKLMGLEDEDGMNQEKKDDENGVSRLTHNSDSITSSSTSRHLRLRQPRRPRRKHRAHKKSVRGDIHLIMTLVLSLMFNAGSKPSDEFFRPLWKLDKCACVGTGLDRKCGCVPYAFIVWQGIIFAGVSIAAVSLGRVMGSRHPYGWMWIAVLVVLIAYAWNVLVFAPYKYRVCLVVMYVIIMFLVDMIMLTSAYWNWGAICKYSMNGCGLIWLCIKAVSQFLGVGIIYLWQGIIYLWQGMKTTLWQLAQACKNEACSTIFGATPDPEQEQEPEPEPEPEPHV